MEERGREVRRREGGKCGGEREGSEEERGREVWRREGGWCGGGRGKEGGLKGILGGEREGSEEEEEGRREA